MIRLENKETEIKGVESKSSLALKIRRLERILRRVITIIKFKFQEEKIKETKKEKTIKERLIRRIERGSWKGFSIRLENKREEERIRENKKEMEAKE